MSDQCPFEILSIAPVWPVDAGTVHRARLAAAARFHPDRARDPVERSDFETRMGSANRAAEHLLDPVTAATAVLRAHGADAGELPLPPSELMELLERREWFEEHMGGGSVARQEAADWAASERATLSSRFGEALADGSSSGSWDEARRVIARLRALARMTDTGSARRG